MDDRPPERKLSVDELEDLARTRTQAKWREMMPGYQLPDESRKLLTMGMYFDSDSRIFELYLAGDSPEEAVVLTRASLDEYTGEGTIEIFVDRMP